MGSPARTRPLEAIRNVIASPLGPTIPPPHSTPMRLRTTSKPCLRGEPALWALPSKFGILVDGGGVLPLADITADIMVRAL